MSHHERTLAQVLLLSARLAALRVLLRDVEGQGARAYRNAFLELGHQALGFDLPATFAGALFVRPRAQAEFSGLLSALRENQKLIERHDEDWFRNPRAIAELRAELDSPATFELDEAALTHGGDALLSWANEKL